MAPPETLLLTKIPSEQLFYLFKIKYEYINFTYRTNHVKKILTSYMFPVSKRFALSLINNLCGFRTYLKSKFKKKVCLKLNSNIFLPHDFRLGKQNWKKIPSNRRLINHSSGNCYNSFISSIMSAQIDIFKYVKN